MHFLKRLSSGFMMGFADLIPGISGGTIAFILGIWEELIVSLNLCASGLLKRDTASFIKGLKFLAPLVLGMASAIFLFAKTVDSLLNSPSERVWLYSAFFGLIIASSVLCFSKVQKWNFRVVIFCSLSFVAAVFMTFAKVNPEKGSNMYHIPLHLLGPISGKARNVDSKFLTSVDEKTISAMVSKGILKTDDTIFSANSLFPVSIETLNIKNSSTVDPWVIFCGAAAISAMLLPGISGSYLLVILGMYATTIGHTADFFHALKEGNFDKDSFLFLAQFALGIVIGATLFSKVISFLFKRYHDIALAALGGFVLGSLRAVWPFWTYSSFIDPLKIEKGPRLISEAPILPEDSLISALLIAVLGFGLVFLIEFIAKRKELTQSHKDAKI